MIIKLSNADTKDDVSKLMQLYLHDLSKYKVKERDIKGRYKYEYFDSYWADPERFPYILIKNAELIGFAFVRKLNIQVYSIAEFYIIKKFRCSGYGKRLAKEIFDMHLGTWSIAQLENNKSAQTFWRKVVSSYTNGNFSESYSKAEPKGPVIHFHSKANQ